MQLAVRFGPNKKINERKGQTNKLHSYESLLNFSTLFHKLMFL